MPPAGNPFPHLPLILRHQGPARLHGGGSESAQTTAAKQDRPAHSATLRTSATAISATWQARVSQRQQEHLPILPAGIPILLEVDPGLDQEAANQRKWTPEYQQAYNWMMAFSVISEVPYEHLLTSADDDNWSSYTFNSSTKSYDATDLFNTHRDRFWKYYSILNGIDEKGVQDKDLYFSCSC